jgi:hypothetical protein
MPNKRTLTGTLQHLVVARPAKFNGVALAVGTVLTKGSARLAGARISSLIARGYLKVPGQLPLRSNKDFRAFHITPGDYKKMDA